MRRLNFSIVNANRKAKQEVRQPNRRFPPVHTCLLPGRPAKRERSQAPQRNPYAPPVECGESARSIPGLFLKLKLGRRKSRERLSNELKNQILLDMSRHEKLSDGGKCVVLLSPHLKHATDAVLALLLADSKESRQMLLELGVPKEQINSWHTRVKERIQKVSWRAVVTAVSLTAILGGFSLMHAEWGIFQMESSIVATLSVPPGIGVMLFFGVYLTEAWQELRGSGWLAEEQLRRQPKA